MAKLPRIELHDDLAVITARIDQMVAEAREWWYQTSDEDLSVKIGDRAHEFLLRSLHDDNPEAVIDVLMYHAAEIGVLYCLQQWGANLARFDAAREGYVEPDSDRFPEEDSD